MRVRIYDDRLECFVGQRPALTLCRGRSEAEGRHGHVVDYRHVIHSLRRKPMALLNLVYRDALFPLPAYRLAWQKLLADGDPRRACKSMVSLLALAHDRGCEAELAGALTEQMAGVGAAGIRVIDVAALQARFAPVSATMPDIAVNLPAVASYDVLLPSMGVAA
jgi:hypothetical protein